MDEQGEKIWTLAKEMMEEIPKVRDRHAQQMKKIAEMDVEMEMTKMKAEELAQNLVERNKDIEATRAKVEEFSLQLAEKNKHIDEIGRKAQALTELLWEKNKELEDIRRKAEADIMQLEEAHRLETDNVRFQAQQSEAEYHRATFERLRRTLQEKEARQSQLEKELLETRLMAGGQNMAPGLTKDLSLPIEIQKLQLQSNLASDAEAVDTSQEMKSKSDNDRERGRDLSIEFNESALPDRVESYEFMKARELEVERKNLNMFRRSSVLRVLASDLSQSNFLQGAETSVQNGSRDSRQALKQTNPKLLPPVVPLRRKQRFIR